MVGLLVGAALTLVVVLAVAFVIPRIRHWRERQRLNTELRELLLEAAERRRENPRN